MGEIYNIYNIKMSEKSKFIICQMLKTEMFWSGTKTQKLKAYPSRYLSNFGILQ